MPEATTQEMAPNSVILHVYDLSRSLQVANKVLTFSMHDVAMGGAFHVGVEAYGSEWSYGSGGVVADPPRTADGHIYRCSIHLGQTTLIQWVMELHELCQTWSGSDYDMLGHNCCSFAGELCRRLGVKPLPPWVDRFARLLHQGRNAGSGVWEAGVKASRTLDNGVQSLVDRLREPNASVKADLNALASRPRGEGAQADPNVELRLPKSQIVVQGQHVSMAPHVCSEHGDGSFPGSGPPASGPMPPPVEFAAAARGEYREAPAAVYVGWGEEDPSRFASGISTLAPNPTCGWPDANCEAFRTMSPPSTIFPIGALVEYESVSQGTWILAHVMGFDPATGLYCLTCRSQVPASRIRWAPPRATMPLPAEAPWSLHNAPAMASQQVPMQPYALLPGTPVEYESASSEDCWIPAVVLAFYPESGLYDLDCKQQVSRRKIRLVEPFPIGAEVEYRSTVATGQGLGWVRGQVLAQDASTGLYDLTCKAQAPRSHIRWPPGPSELGFVQAAAPAA